MSENDDAELKRKKVKTALTLVAMALAVYIATVIFKQQ